MLCEMEMKEEQLVVGLSNNNDATHIIAKGKRTKRLRLLSSPCGGATTVITSTCSSVTSGDSSSTTTYESADQEDEDMANCLILLAQGGGGGGENSHHHHHHKHHDHDGDHNKTEEKGSRKFAELATASNSNTKVGFYIYECKTCNRTFPSFQALGGHRASHKKLRLMMPEEKKLPQPAQPQPQPQPQQRLIIANYDRIEEPHMKATGPPISLQLDRAFHANKTKIHECSICGSEFTSGQALGGHMRRHRATAAVQVEVQPRHMLELDLNLPAPEEDLRESKFQFTATQKSMVLSAAPALVDCHY